MHLVIKKIFLAGLLLSIIYPSETRFANKHFAKKETTQFYPYLEWQIIWNEWNGNPFDVIGKVIFKHASTGKTVITHMFYGGENLWKFRFTGTQIGEWHFRTTSDYESLDGLEGVVVVKKNPDKNARGFLKPEETWWIWQGTEEAIVPQFVMYKPLNLLYSEIDAIENDIDIFLDQHGFSGFHIPSVSMGWFDIEKSGEGYDQLDHTPNPDNDTFATLEKLITNTHQAGGIVHIWMWGDESRRQTPLKWGANSEIDQRLQRYIAARLGPLPGWSMGYGFDLFEWTNTQMLDKWHHYMHQHMGYFHFLGARSHKRQLTQISEKMDYASYEQHQPDYQQYVASVEKRPYKPSFSEDRFRIRNNSKYPDKDYNLTLTRRGLWHSTMAGGVANIWGNLAKPDSSSNQAFSLTYPNFKQLKTYDIFFFEKGPVF